MPVLLMQMVNGSLITTVLRLRAAHREVTAHRIAEAQPTAQVLPITKPLPVVEMAA
jgi:CDP-diacylglycerol--glycerol-3-phosphate 3-phosphatidyltransferase